MNTKAFLSGIKELPWYEGQIQYVHEIPERQARYGVLDKPLHPRLAAILKSQGVDYLYEHQTDAINSVLRGDDVIVSTGAASGKSLCYHIPVLETLLEDATTRALYLFPTKALAQDQFNSLSKLIPPDTKIRHGIFDGDTSSEDRADVRRRAKLLITNPDMLHLGILPNHRNWYRMIRGLKYVVLDEAHVYRGVFGSHVLHFLSKMVSKRVFFF